MRVKDKDKDKKYYCIECGIEISSNAQRCIKCANKNKQIITKEMKREELKDLIRT